jgi:hypothetical protein
MSILGRKGEHVTMAFEAKLKPGENTFLELKVLSDSYKVGRP